MALYFIGDLQSCCTPFESLLRKIDFSPSRDELVLLGDMINRGPQTLETLDTIMQYDGAIRCLLGNHDLHFLSVAYGLRKELPQDTLTPLLNSPKKEHYINWIRHQPMALYIQDWLLVHAGVLPQWTLANTLAHAKEVETILRSANAKEFVREVFGNQPDYWDNALTGIDRLRVIVNALTRIRFCYADGRLDMGYKKGMINAPEHLIPWFNMPNRQTQDTKIAFGHWSTLENIFPAPNVMALDTGCLWGGKLTAAKIQENQPVDIIQVSCGNVGISPL
ncbi:MAG: symmetrical bis(5'-nucleosyl)-tetraphosphatase [Saezia sp.]